MANKFVQIKESHSENRYALEASEEEFKQNASKSNVERYNYVPKKERKNLFFYKDEKGYNFVLLGDSSTKVCLEEVTKDSAIERLHFLISCVTKNLEFISSQPDNQPDKKE